MASAETHDAAMPSTWCRGEMLQDSTVQDPKHASDLRRPSRKSSAGSQGQANIVKPLAGYAPVLNLDTWVTTKPKVSVITAFAIESLVAAAEWSLNIQDFGSA